MFSKDLLSRHLALNADEVPCKNITVVLVWVCLVFFFLPTYSLLVFLFINDQTLNVCFLEPHSTSGTVV